VPIRTWVACLFLWALTASAQAAPRWCKSFKPSGQVFPDQAKKAVDDFRSSHNHSFLIRAAGFTCALPDDKATAEILQVWMTETGLPESDAIASIEARLDPTWEDQHSAFCKALAIPSGEDEGNAMAVARASLFGCKDNDDDDAAWMHRKPYRIAALNRFLDRGAMDRDRDEIVRLAWVAGEVGHMLDPNETGPVLANYAVAQYDIKALVYSRALKQLETAPYRGSNYARVVLGETIAHTKAAIARLDAAVAKRTADPRWKDLIITVPQNASAAWLAAAAAHKEMLNHSVSAPGCEATLRADVAPMLKTRAKRDLEEIPGGLSDDPLAGLMLWRLTSCIEQNGDAEVAKIVGALSARVRPINGPRTAAFVATANAVAALGKKAPFSSHYDMTDPGSGSGWTQAHSLSSLTRGVIASAKAGKGGVVKLTFVKDRVQYTARECKDTNKIDQVTNDGKVIYRQACRDAGKAWADRTPAPISVPASCTAGLAKGRFVRIEDTTPWAVFSDNSQKKVVAAYCLPFE
jgi:hypothetical protein